jgi:hypothetical protein
MPSISRFFGIVITMYFNEHGPPHFHAEYGDRMASFVIETLEIRDGSLPARQARQVRRWAAMHKDHLQANWARARAKKPLTPIPPLS